MNAIENLITSFQLQEIVDAVTSKISALFVKKSIYNAKVSELESTISSLVARIEVLEAHPIDESINSTPEQNENEPVT